MTSLPQHLDELPADDYLVAARRADLALARKVAAECRRPVPAYDRRDVGPTEAWRQHLITVRSVERHRARLNQGQEAA